MKTKRALVLLAAGFEEIEMVTIVNVLRRAGVEVTLAGIDAGALPGSHAVRVTADCPAAQVSGRDFDLVFLPGGQPGVDNLRKEAQVQRILREAAEAQKTIGAICAAPSILAEAGYLSGRRATGHPSVRSAMEKATDVKYTGAAVTIDGPVVTSRSPGTAMECALTLVGILCGDEQAKAVETSLLARV